MQLAQEEKKKLLFNTWMRFNSNVGALYSFFEKTLELVDTTDAEKIKSISTKLAGLLREKPEDVQKDLSIFFPSIDDLDIYPDIRNDASVKEMFEALQDSRFLEQITEWEKHHPFKSQKFLEIIYSGFVDPPMSGIILRKSMLITLMTFLEILVQDMFRDYYLNCGETRERASELAVKMTNEGWGKRLSNLEKIGYRTRTQSLYKDEIIEMSKRRNLLIHNDGVVDQKYIENAPQKYKSIKPGSIFVVSTNYFQAAIDIVYTLGFFLCLASWQSHGISEKEQSKKIDEFLIPTLNHRRYSLVLRLTKNLNEAVLPRWATGTLLVDRAVAFRELGDMAEVRRIVSKLKNVDQRWSISISILMLTNHLEELKVQLMDRQIPPNISSWPLFDPIKDEIWFKKIFTLKQKQYLPKARKKRSS